MEAELRSQHPYFMYDHMLAQPQAFAEAVVRNEKGIQDLANQVASCRRLFLVGTGTSYHAALAAQEIFRTYGGGLDVRAIPAFDFSVYPPTIDKADVAIVLSHRGNKTYSLRSTEMARAKGALTVLVTGMGLAEASRFADRTLETVPQEKSSAHTISYTGAVAVLAALALRVGHLRTGVESLPADFLTSTLPKALAQSLQTEDAARKLAQRLVDRRKIWVTGGGPGAVIAQETALKIKETSYMEVEGLAVETLIHGPCQAADPRDAFILVAPQGPALERLSQFSRQVDAIGAQRALVGDDSVESLTGGSVSCLRVPRVPEPFSALTCLYPLQLLTYHLALLKGTNPDSFRKEDPAFDQATRQLTL